MQTKNMVLVIRTNVLKYYYLFYSVLRSRALLCVQEALAVAPP